MLIGLCIGLVATLLKQSIEALGEIRWRRTKSYLKVGYIRYDTIRYDTRCCFNVRSKADMSQLNLPHGTDN